MSWWQEKKLTFDKEESEGCLILAAIVLGSAFLAGCLIGSCAFVAVVLVW